VGGLDEEAARARVDPHGRLGDLVGRRVLCLAGGGGQQSAAFARLGARVTVVDLDDGQLARDRDAETVVRADMRDLSPLAGSAFDVVYQPYSINFVPDLRAVVDGVGAVLTGVPPPREYTHTLGAVVAALVEVGLHLFALDEHTGPADAAPGTWAHLKSVLPPWFTLWARRPGAAPA
jgi:SAM-dependent methyltransferase